MIKGAIVRVCAFMIMAILLSCLDSFSQKNEVLNIDSETEHLFLMPFVSECEMEIQSSTDSIIQSLCLRAESGEFEGAYQKLFKFSLFLRDSIVNYSFVSKLGNYATDLYFIYKDSDNRIVESVYYYNDKTKDDKEWINEAVFPLPAIKDTLEIYVLGDYNSWAINEWHLYSNDGYNKDKTILTRQAIVYFVLVLIFLILALIGYFILKKNIIAYYAFYLFSTSLYIFKELNTLPLQVFYDYPALLNFINESIFGIFLLSFLFYLRSICDKENSYTFEPLFLKILVVLTVISIFLTSFIMNSKWSPVLSYFVTYGVNIYFVIQVIPNFKKSIPLRFFFLGILIIVILGILMEFQVYNIINFPGVFYWMIPGLILELLLIGIGIIYNFKLRSTELQDAKIANSNLNENIINLEKKVNHSKSAYQTLVANRVNGELNLPSEYLDYPLTQREIEVIHLLNKGYNNQALADEMFISRNTVKTHLKNIYKKLDVKDRDAAVEKMKSYGII